MVELMIREIPIIFEKWERNEVVQPSEEISWIIR